jgi:isopentenyl diphosphate isomerase/L-lactate dehydrogenase-like FMN-dependent dehydrogenase
MSYDNGNLQNEVDMVNLPDASASRRRFLKFLAGSPLLTAELRAAIQQEPALIKSPAEALDVFDFEPVARQAVPPAHFGYMATGVDGEFNLRANRDGFGKYAIRPRRLVDVRNIDTSVELFGTRWKTPIILAPVGGQKAFHTEGEVAVARAARARDQLQILSTSTTSSIEEVTEARGAPVWFQLYPQGSLAVAQMLVKRAEAAGSPVICLTVDLLAGRNTETDKRMARLDTRTCTNCHTGNRNLRRPMLSNIDIARLGGQDSGLTWDFVRRLKDGMRARLVIKGIESGEDAALCAENGADGIIVSNHGGRASDTGRSTVECLPEVLDAVGGRVPVLIDGGFRRGTDILKALALGAKAVCIGRPYIWGLMAFGQPGVERVLDILKTEFELTMRQTGVTSLTAINKSYIVQR